MSRRITLDQAVTALKSGGVIAYATEAVFGLGCDPDNEQAVMRLLQIKQRPIEKGLILLAASQQQLQPYVDFTQLTEAQLNRVESTWPGPFTWIVPAQSKTPSWVTGQFDSVAVRVTAHQQAAELTQAFGKPIISTSANLTTFPPGTSVDEVIEALGDLLDGVLDSQVGEQRLPSTIRDAITGDLIRAG